MKPILFSLPFLYRIYVNFFFFLLNPFDKEPFGNLLFTLLVPSPSVITKIAPSYLALGSVGEAAHLSVQGC